MSEKYDGKCLNSPFRKVIITVTKKGGHAIVEKVRYMISDAAALAGPGIHLLSGTVDPEMKKRIPLYPLFPTLGAGRKKR